VKAYELIERLTQIVTEECGMASTATSNEVTLRNLYEIHRRFEPIIYKEYERLITAPKSVEAQRCAK
jgi:hypothetical protein